MIAYPTILEVLLDMRRYKINPNRFDKLWKKHKTELGRRVACLDGVPIPPKDRMEELLDILSQSMDVLNTQSGQAEFSIGYSTPQVKSANLQFVDEASANMYSVGTVEDDTRQLEDTPDVELADFFKRPIKIFEEEWGTGTALAATFDPWGLFFNNKRVVNRISNFNLLRSTLHLKVVLNGNGFQYGRAILAYNPLNFFDTMAPTTLVDEDVMQLSQLPHLYLNPTTSQGGDLELPFFYHYNSGQQPTLDYQLLGQCFLKSLNALKHANGASDKVTISVFAWMENVTLAVPTSMDSSLLIPQSGEVDEANSEGTISKPATALADAAAIVSKVPLIGSYAKATEMPLRMVANLAKAMGYCRPTVTKNPDPFRNTAISSLAVTNVPDNAQKLTVDDKQELTIDPAIAGIPSEDTMNIKSIASRESWLTTFSWAVGTAPDTLLWNSRVTPVTWNQSGTPTAYHFPACCMAALPFKYWTGTMNFRFQVVASNYHKGRLRIAYDPNFFDATPEYNVNYMHIVDIAERNDFTISVTNGQRVTLLDHASPGADSATEIYSTSRYTSSGPGNGVLAVSVLNELTVPNSVANNDIEINVFVSMGDDFEVFVPDDFYQYFVLAPQSGQLILEPQSGEVAIDSTPLDSKPMNDEQALVNGSMQMSDKVNLVYTGESIKSFRTLLKRYNLHTGISPLNASSNVISLRQNSFPYLRGNVTGAIHLTNLAAPYNFCNTVLLHWITFAFSGWRGSIRWKVLPRGGWDHLTTHLERGGISQSDQYSLSHNAPESPTSDSDAAHETVARNGTSPINDRPLAGKKGMTYALHTVNPCVEVEIPFYSPARFSPGRKKNWTTTDFFIPYYNEVFDYRAWGRGFEGEESYVDFYVAAGEDYQTYFFKGLPRMYYEPTPPLPSPT